MKDSFYFFHLSVNAFSLNKAKIFVFGEELTYKMKNSIHVQPTALPDG